MGKRRRRRTWALINAALLLTIIAILTFIFNDNGDGGTLPPPLVQSTVSPSQEVVETPDPTQTQATPTPEPQTTTKPAATATTVPVESSEIEPAPISPTPVVTPEAAVEDGLISGLPTDASSDSASVRLSFGGDVIFAGKVGELLEKKGYDYPYVHIHELFKKDDLSIINLETPVTEGGTGAANKQFVFKSPPKALNAMKDAGIDAVNLANNHTLDQGEQGLRDTLSSLEQRGISYVGAGLNEKSAYSPQYFERKGITIGLLGFTRVMPEANWRAGKNKPGLASVYDSAEGLKAIAETKKKADIVVVMVHWGKERASQADDVQQSLGRSFIDAGADLVIGGHPHVLQGIEPYKGKWIAYSTGNLIFTRSTAPATWETAVFQAECNAKGQCSMQLKPFHAELGQPVPMNEEDGLELFRKVETLSWGRIKIGSDGMIVDSSM